ncbi:MAG TPA: hypothetical protein VIH21_02165 [Dehalococcoidia bacterium]
MQKNKKLWIAGGAVTALAIVAGATGIAAKSMTDSDDPITGPALEKASAAALAYTAGGRVTETEDGDEESRYEVEVTLDDGSQVDVQLDENFNVVASKADAEETGGGDSQ